MDTLDKIQAIRAGGAVKRHHTMPTVGEDTNAQHTYNCLNLLFQLHPEPTMGLVKAMLWHDVPEVFTGDIPSPVKRFSDKIGRGVKELEDQIERALEIHVDLTPEEKAWLKGIDRAEFIVWAEDQVLRGNYSAEAKLVASFHRLMGDPNTPDQIKEFVREMEIRPLPQVDEVNKWGLRIAKEPKGAEVAV